MVFDVLEGGHKGTASMLAAIVTSRVVSAVIELLRAEDNNAVAGTSPIGLDTSGSSEVHTRTTASLVLDWSDDTGASPVIDPAVGVVIASDLVSVDGLAHILSLAVLLFGEISGHTIDDLLDGHISELVDVLSIRSFAGRGLTVVRKHFEQVLFQDCLALGHLSLIRVRFTKVFGKFLEDFVKVLFIFKSRLEEAVVAGQVFGAVETSLCWQDVSLKEVTERLEQRTDRD